MPVCSYLVIPESGALEGLARRLRDLPGCDVAKAENRGLLLLVTDTRGPEEDAELRSRLEEMEGIHALVLAFGEIDPEAGRSALADGERETRSRSLPVVDPGGIDPASPLPPSLPDLE